MKLKPEVRKCGADSIHASDNRVSTGAVKIDEKRVSTGAICIDSD